MHTPDWFSSVMPGPGVALQSHVKALVGLTLIFKSMFSFSMHNFFHQIQTELEVLSRAERGGPTFLEKGGLTHLGPAFSTP